MDWENILILILGGAIGIVTNFFTNRYQLQRWREEWEEQRREAKIQAREKWIEHDIETINSSIARTLELLDEARNFSVLM